MSTSLVFWFDLHPRVAFTTGVSFCARNRIGGRRHWRRLVSAASGSVPAARVRDQSCGRTMAAAPELATRRGAGDYGAGDRAGRRRRLQLPRGWWRGFLKAAPVNYAHEAVDERRPLQELLQQDNGAAPSLSPPARMGGPTSSSGRTIRTLRRYRSNGYSRTSLTRRFDSGDARAPNGLLQGPLVNVRHGAIASAAPADRSR